MVGAPPRLTRRVAASAWRAALPLLLTLAPAWAVAAPSSYVATGHCRDGLPHGAYELRMQDGTLRVAGAFARGKRTGSFLYWSSAGVRIAHLPYDDDAMSGTVALWYSAGDAKAEPRRKLEAVYVRGRNAGTARSWYADGRPRAIFRYERGVLADAQAWDAQGAPLPEESARAMAERDAVADAQFYGTLEALVRDHPPPCSTAGGSP